MASAPALDRYSDQRNRRFSDDVFSLPWPAPEPKPGRQDPAPNRCPYCDQRIPQARTSIVSMFFGGFRRLAGALWMILGAVLRGIRLTVATIFWCVGLVGSCCRSVGVRIAHPDDRRFFTSVRRPSTSRN